MTTIRLGTSYKAKTVTQMLGERIWYVFNWAFVCPGNTILAADWVMTGDLTKINEAFGDTTTSVLVDGSHGTLACFATFDVGEIHERYITITAGTTP